MIERIDCPYKPTPRHFTPFYLLHWLSSKQITVVDIGGYEQPKGVLVCVTLSFAFKFLTTFTAEAGIKWTRKWQWSYLNFKLFVRLFYVQNHSCNSNIMARLKYSEIVTKVQYYNVVHTCNWCTGCTFTYGKHQTVEIHGIIIESQSKMR